MKQYSVAEARQNFAQALDEAEQGTEVIIERRGVHYRLVVDAPPPQAPTVSPMVEVLDPQLLEKGWSWKLADSGKAALRVGKRRPK